MRRGRAQPCHSTACQTTLNNVVNKKNAMPNVMLTFCFNPGSNLNALTQSLRGEVDPGMALRSEGQTLYKKNTAER